MKIWNVTENRIEKFSIVAQMFGRAKNRIREIFYFDGIKNSYANRTRKTLCFNIMKTQDLTASLYFLLLSPIFTFDVLIFYFSPTIHTYMSPLSLLGLAWRHISVSCAQILDREKPSYSNLLDTIEGFKYGADDGTRTRKMFPS